MTPAQQLRKTALSLPEVEEGTRSGMVSFAVCGAGFAVLTKDGERVQLRLGADDVESLLAHVAASERLMRGAALLGATIPLADVNGQQLNHWVRRAWKHRAPKRLATSAEAAENAEPGDGGLPPAIGRPATRALAGAGITTLDGVARLSDAELTSLHGVGETAALVLRDALAARDKR